MIDVTLILIILYGFRFGGKNDEEKSWYTLELKKCVIIQNFMQGAIHSSFRHIYSIILPVTDAKLQTSIEVF